MDSTLFLLHRKDFPLASFFLTMAGTVHGAVHLKSAEQLHIESAEERVISTAHV